MCLFNIHRVQVGFPSIMVPFGFPLG